VVRHALERRGIPAERDRGEIDHQITGDYGRGDSAVVVVHVAHAGGADPAKEIASAVADLFLTQDDVFHIPALGLKLRCQRCTDALAGAVICVRTIEKDCLLGNGFDRIWFSFFTPSHPQFCQLILFQRRRSEVPVEGCVIQPAPYHHLGFLCLW
jgi:hypothetical protein